MPEIQSSVGSKVAIPKVALENLIYNLKRMGHQVIGPQIQNEAVVYKPLKSIGDLPKGYISQQDAGFYRLVYTGHQRFFDVTPGADSWKQFFFPPQTELMHYKRQENGHWRIEEKHPHLTPIAFFGVFPCDLAAIQIQDLIFMCEEWKDPFYW